MPVLRVAPSAGPLRAEHERLLRTALKRGDAAPEPSTAIDVTAYSAAALTTARRAWLRRMADEHRSATVFSALLPQLIEAEAPLDFQTVVLRMAMDELRHGALAGAVVEALGGRAEIELPSLIEGVAAHPSCTPRVRALRNVLYACCLSETISLALTTAEREHSSEPVIARVLDQLVGDEVLHARFGWLNLDEALPRLDPDELESLRAYVPFGIDHLRARLTSRLGARPEAPEDELRRLGVSPPELMRAIIEDTLRDAIGPRLEETLR